MSNKLVNNIDTSLDETFELVRKEYYRAAAEYGFTFYSMHEAFGVLSEEVDEFWHEVKQKQHNKQSIKEELMQIAQVAIKAILTLEE